MEYREITSCRSCGSPRLETVLTLGTLAVSDFPADANGTKLFAPLTIVQCAQCQLAQLGHTVDRAFLFRDQYWYASGINGLMREELRTVVRRARQFVKIHDHDVVLDIGANDGTLCRSWHEHAWEGRPHRIAVEPAQSFARMLTEASETPITDVFPTAQLDEFGSMAKVVTTIAMFYSVDPLGPFVAQVKHLLAPDGVWIIQLQDLRQMLTRCAVDNICHEHVCYFSVTTLARLLQPHGLALVHAEETPINGGSVRVFVQHAGSPKAAPSDELLALVRAEEDLASPTLWEMFKAAVHGEIAALRSVVTAARDRVGGTVDLLGASTKGNTLLQLAGLGPEQIRCAWERHPGKIGRHTITGIPIVGEEVGRAQPPDLLVCPIWQFKQGLVERERAYLQGGGRIYFPLPSGTLHQWGGR